MQSHRIYCKVDKSSRVIKEKRKTPTRTYLTTKSTLKPAERFSQNKTTE